MPSLCLIGTEIKEIDLLDYIPAYEGSINQYYGQIGSGKTYTATADVLEDLKNGQVVYCNWFIKWLGYDQRNNLWFLLLGLLGFKTEFYVFPKENLKFIKIDENFTDTLGRLTDCSVYLDEGHLAFDSYKMAKMNMNDRANVLHTRHFDRCINIISQRASAIHITLRANVNRYFKIEKSNSIIFKWLRVIRFYKSEYQDLTADEKPDEEQEPISTQSYWGHKKIFNCYSTKYMRGSTPASQINAGILYKIKPNEAWKKIKHTLTLSKHKNILKS